METSRQEGALRGSTLEAQAMLDFLFILLGAGTLALLAAYALALNRL
jgi:hypothetical protein